MLATRRIGEQKFSCPQFASSAHNVRGDGNFIYFLCKFSIDMNHIVFYYSFSQK